MFNKIVLHVPHASVENYSCGWADKFLMWPLVKDLTDWHTDLLFAPSADNARVTMVRFPYSRFYVDAERLDQDPMEAEGQGKFYTRYGGQTRHIAPEELPALTAIYNQHHACLAAALAGDNALLVDCHSFANEKSPEVDVCIGYNDDASFPGQEAVDLIRRTFEHWGYRVGINHPYSNAKTLGLDPDGSYKSVMIELNKSIYMNENTTALLPGTAVKVNHIIRSLYDRLLDE